MDGSWWGYPLAQAWRARRELTYVDDISNQVENAVTAKLLKVGLVSKLWSVMVKKKSNSRLWYDVDHEAKWMITADYSIIFWSLDELWYPRSLLRPSNPPAPSLGRRLDRLSRSHLPSGELTFCYRKSPCLMGKSTCKGISPQNMALYMVPTYLHFRSLKFPLNLDVPPNKSYGKIRKRHEASDASGMKNT